MCCAIMQVSFIGKSDAGGADCKAMLRVGVLQKQWLALPCLLQ